MIKFCNLYNVLKLSIGAQMILIVVFLNVYCTIYEQKQFLTLHDCDITRF